MPYAVVDADEVEPGSRGAFERIRKPLGLTAFASNLTELAPGPDALPFVAVDAESQDAREPGF